MFAPTVCLIIEKELPGNIYGLQLSLRTEQTDTPYYHYSHGLKKHDGNCQRIVHGHRSKIVIEMDGVRNGALEAQWGERWRDIYLGSEEDMINAALLNLSEKAKQNIADGQCEDHIGFAYDASQGRFEMLMPASECEVLPHDSTVECLAQFIAEQLKQDSPASSFKVFAFEGVGKGAVAISA